MTAKLYRSVLVSLAVAGVCFLMIGCAVEAARREVPNSESATVKKAEPAGKKFASGATIEIEPNSPADTVRAFYQNLKEGKIRAAIYLTNLRPAIEGLTDAELKEFQVDFEAIAAQVPEKLEINGEIVSGETATVTAKLPGDNPDKLEVQEIHLRRDNGVWVILSVDEDAEKKVKQEGKNYFYALRIETHEEEAKQMLDRIAKAQMVYVAQNGGNYGEIANLIGAGLLPDDVRSSESTGYIYSVKLSPDKKNYTATAAPAAYGKTGKLTFTVELNGKSPRLTSRDEGK
jgi:hypothetical protein